MRYQSFNKEGTPDNQRFLIVLNNSIKWIVSHPALERLVNHYRVLAHTCSAFIF
jgi:hypothetical protein